MASRGVLTISLLLLGLLLIGVALADTPVRRLPLSPAVIYLGVGWLAGWLFNASSLGTLQSHSRELTVLTEFFLLVSLFAVGLRLRARPTVVAWRVALLLAGPGMVVTIGLATLAALWLLDAGWPLALLMACVLAPTDPVLASEVQMRSNDDRDTVRMALTAEGGLNDGTAFPAVMLALGLIGLHPTGTAYIDWWWGDLIWPIGGGAAVGAALGISLGRSLRWLLARGDGLARDELVYLGAVALAYGLARALDLSAFIVAFMVGVTLLLPLRREKMEGGGHLLAERMIAFGGRCERLVEAAAVLGIGLALHRVGPNLAQFGFALLLLFGLRPLAVWLVVRRRVLPLRQRRLVGWFGIRGIGSLFYLLFSLEHGMQGQSADRLITVVLTCIATSILLHGVSATPLMSSYQRLRDRRATGPSAAQGDE